MVSVENNTQAIRCSPTHFLQLHRLKPDVTLHVHRKKKKKKKISWLSRCSWPPFVLVFMQPQFDDVFRTFWAPARWCSVVVQGEHEGNLWDCRRDKIAHSSAAQSWHGDCQSLSSRDRCLKTANQLAGLQHIQLAAVIHSSVSWVYMRTDRSNIDLSCSTFAS